MPLTATRDARLFQAWQIMVPVEDGDVVQFSEPATRDLIWRSIRIMSEVADHGRALFPGTLAQRNRLWREFRSFVRQAQAYDQAAATVRGPSAALLYYYAVLNLAKAELLRTNPADVLAQTPPLRHGLGAKISASNSIAGDTLSVGGGNNPGVFPLLYRKRTGIALAERTLPIRRLLAQVPEVGWELAETHLSKSALAGMVHAGVTDQQQTWSFIAVAPASDEFLSSGVSRRLFLNYFEPVRPPAGWHDVLAVSRRARTGYVFFESRNTWPANTTTWADVCNSVSTDLKPILAPPEDDRFEAMVYESLYRTRMVPMPADMARYALMFYASSLVRYRPSKLDPSVQTVQAWLLEAFIDQAYVPLLQAALSGIAGRPHRFLGTHFFRT